MLIITMILLDATFMCIHFRLKHLTSILKLIQIIKHVIEHIKQVFQRRNTMEVQI
jgi:hypothetical protein